MTNENLYDLYEALLGDELLDQCLNDPEDFDEFTEAWNKGLIQPFLD